MSNSESLPRLQSLLNERKFVEDMELLYFRAPDEETRARCETEVNRLLEGLIAVAPSGPGKSEVLERFKVTLDAFVTEDSEERDRMLGYVEQVMEAFGIESSDGLLNTWRYGFDPNELS